MKRRITILSAVLLLPALCSCSSVISIFGPTPNQELVELAASEQRDGNSEYADSLFAEVARLCGTKDDDTVPDTCQVNRDEAVEKLGQEQTPSLLEATVPAESRPLVVSIAVDKAAHNANPAPLLSSDTQLSEADQEQAQKLLSWEQQMVWAFNFSLAFAGSAEEKEHLEDLILLHENAVETLEGVVANPKAPAAGYQSGEVTLPKAAEDIPSFITELSHRTQQIYEQAAIAAAPSPKSTQAKDGAPAAPGTGWLEWLVNNAARNSQAQS